MLTDDDYYKLMAFSERAMDILAKYENEKYVFEKVDPIEAIKFRLDQMNYTQVHFAGIISSKSHASEVLNYKRKLSIDMIRNIHDYLHISADVLIRDYELK